MLLVARRAKGHGLPGKHSGTSKTGKQARGTCLLSDLCVVDSNNHGLI